MNKDDPILKEPNIRELLLETDTISQVYNAPIIGELLAKYGVQKLNDAKKYFDVDNISSDIIVHMDYCSKISLLLSEIDSITPNSDGTSNINLKDYDDLIYTINKNKINIDYPPNYYYECMQEIFVKEDLDLFNASNDKVIFKPKEFRDKIEFLARRLVKSGWARPGDDIQKIFDHLNNEVKGIVVIRDGDEVSKKLTTDKYNFSSSAGYIFWTIKKDMRIEFIFHELLHSYFRKYGKDTEVSGITSTAGVCRGKFDNSVLNITAEYEEQLKDFNNRFSDENAKNGLDMINEGITDLILFDSIYEDKYFMGEGPNLWDRYFCEILTAELLQKAFGEQLKEMYHSGPVGFEKAFDEKFGKGKFFEFCSELGLFEKEIEKLLGGSSLNLTFSFAEYVIDTLQVKLSKSLDKKIFQSLMQVRRDYCKGFIKNLYKLEKEKGTKIVNKNKWIQKWVNKTTGSDSFTYKGKIYSDLYNVKERRIIKRKKESTTARMNRLRQDRYKKIMLDKINAKSKSIQSQGKLPA